MALALARCDTDVTSANALGGIAWINPVEGRTLLLWRTAYCEGAPRALRAEAARSLSPSCSSGGRYTRLSLSRSNVATYAAQRRAAFRDCATIRQGPSVARRRAQRKPLSR